MNDRTPIKVFDRAVKVFAVGAVLLLVALGVLHVLYGDVEAGGVYWFNLDKERNLPTWITGALFFLFACAALAIFAAERRVNRRHAGTFKLPVLWLGVAAAGSLMSLDEMTILHENLFWSEVRTRTQAVGGAWVYLTQWQILFAPAVLLVFCYFAVFFINRFRPRASPFRMAAFGLGCWFFAFLIEGVRERVHHVGAALYGYSALVEEELELAGAVLLTLALLLYLRKVLFVPFEADAVPGGGANRLLNRRSLAALAATAAAATVGVAVVYTVARWSAAEGQPMPRLHRRVAARLAPAPPAERQALVDPAVSSSPPAALRTPPATVRPGPPPGETGPAPAGMRRLSRATLDQALTAGRQYLLRNLTLPGDSAPTPDAETQAGLGVVDPARQAGALWGLALIHGEMPDDDTAAAVRRGIDLLVAGSVTTGEGARYLASTNAETGRTGTMALLALGLAAFLHAGHALSVSDRSRYRAHLDEIMRFLLSLRNEDGHFSAGYRHDSGTASGPPSPAVDGATLLAMIRTAKLGGFDSLKPLVVHSAAAMYQRYVAATGAGESGVAAGPAFVPWSILSFFEIYVSGLGPNARQCADRSIHLAVRMVDAQPLSPGDPAMHARAVSVCAWELARRTGRANAMGKLGPAVDQALRTLTTRPFGGRREAALGVAGDRDEADLDFAAVPHQVQALILARRFKYRR